MGWGEARKPAPPTRADLTRELAGVLGIEIPAHVSAEESWPVLLGAVDIYVRAGKLMGEPSWPSPPAPETGAERDTCPTCHTPGALPASTVCPRCGSTEFGRRQVGADAYVYDCHDCHHERPAP